MNITNLKKRLAALFVVPLLLCLSQAAIAQGTLYSGTDNEEFSGAFSNTGEDRLASTPTAGPLPGATTLIPTLYPINGMGVSAGGNLLVGQPRIETLSFFPFTVFPGNELREINPVDASINFSILAEIPDGCCNEENVFDGRHIWHARHADTIRKLDPEDGSLVQTYFQNQVVGMALIGGQFWISKWSLQQVGTWDPNVGLNGTFTPVFSTPNFAGALAWDPIGQVLWVGQRGGTVTPYDLLGNPLGAPFSPFGATVGNTIDGLAFIPDPGDAVCVLQEKNAGDGDYEIKGQVSIFNRSAETAADVYNYGVPIAASYNPDLPFAPAAISDTSQLFFVDTSQGLSLFMVHDQPDDFGDTLGGRADLHFTLSGDTAAILFEDDPGESFIDTGGTQFDSRHSWVTCCTDGGAIGSLDGDWSMDVSATVFNDITNWQVSSANGPFVPLDSTLYEGITRQVRLQPAPCDLVDLSKQIVEGPDEDSDGKIDAVIEVKQTTTTEYVWKINYHNPGVPEVLITDRAPAESVVMEINGDDNGSLPLGCGEATSFNPGSGIVDLYRGGKVGKTCHSSTGLEWSPASDSEMLLVSIEMRRSPGRGHKDDAFAPTSCGPLYLNEGAQAFELDADTGEPLPEPILESNQLCVAAVKGELLPGTPAPGDYGPEADHDGDGVASFAEACTNEVRTNPCQYDTDGDGVDDGVDECPLQGLPNLTIGDTLGANGCIIPAPE